MGRGGGTGAGIVVIGVYKMMCVVVIDGVFQMLCVVVIDGGYQKLDITY